MSTFEIDITKLPLFSQIFYYLVPKIEICPKYFSDKNPKKQPLSGSACNSYTSQKSSSKIKFKNQFREIEILKNQVQIDRGCDVIFEFP